MLPSSKLLVTIVTSLIYTTFIPFSSAQVASEINIAIQNEQEADALLLSTILQFEPPSEQRKPKSSSAGGSRSSCPDEQFASRNPALSLTPLLPRNTAQWLTIKERPQFLVYVPPTSASAILFQIKNHQDQIVDQSIIPISATQGKIVDISMSNQGTPLQVGEEYQWSVFLLCKYNSSHKVNQIKNFQKSYDLMNEPWTEGHITRIEAPTSLNQKLEKDLSLDLINEYAQQGLWFDTLASLRAMLKQEPQQPQLLNAWQSLLQIQGLDKQISQAPLDN
jgi:hypothetical protein